MQDYTITLGECPDCFSHYVWHESEALYRCGGCAPGHETELAQADIYLEWNQQPVRIRPSYDSTLEVLAIVQDNTVENGDDD